MALSISNVSIYKHAKMKQITIFFITVKVSPTKRLAVYSVSFLSSLTAAVTGFSLHCFLLQVGAALEAAGQQIWLFPYNVQL